MVTAREEDMRQRCSGVQAGEKEEHKDGGDYHCGQSGLHAASVRSCHSLIGAVQVMGEDTAASSTVMSLVDGGHPSALMFPEHVAEVSSAL